MSHRYITHDENGDLLLKTPYNQDFTDALKDLIDKDSRRWDRDAKHWWVDGAWEEELEKLVRSYWGSGAKKASSRSDFKRSRKRDEPMAEGFRSHAYEASEPLHSYAPRTKRSREVPDPIGSVDDYISRIAKEDVSHTIKELTAKVGALMYELDQAKRDQKEANDRAWRLSQQHTKDERTILDLTYKLRLAESLGGSGAMPFRGGRPLNGSKSSAYDVLHLKPDAPPEVVRVVYNALAKIHHPDAGGDEEQMKAINNAYDELGRGK